MHDLAHHIREDLAAHGVPELAGERATIERELARLVRERAEVDQRISVLDRVLFFHTSPDEARRGELDDAIDAARARARTLDARIDGAYDALAGKYPPFEIARRIARCFELAHDGLEVRGILFGRVAERSDLSDELEAIARTIRDTWLPDHDPAALHDELADPDAARRIAGRPTHVAERADDPRRGWAPAEPDELAPLIARRLLDNGFFDVRAAYAQAVEDHAARRAEYEAAREAVPWFDKLNVFSLSDAELARNRAATEWRASLAHMRDTYEEEHVRVLDALGGYPPLAVYQAVLACASAVGVLETARDAAVDLEGRAVKRRVVAHAPLVIAALRRLEAAFDRAFPAFPRPDALIAHADTEQRAAGDVEAHAHAVGELFDGLDAGSAPDLVARALVHAALRGAVRERLEHVRDRISFLDRLVFWKRTRAEEEAAALATRDDWNAEWLGRLGGELLEAARRAGGDVGPFVVRDRTLEAIAAVRAIHTDGGSSSSPRSCSVYGRGEALMALSTIRHGLARFYGVDGDRAALMRATLAELRRGGPPRVTPHPPGPVLTPLDPDALIVLLASRLRETDYAAIAERSADTNARIAELRADKDEVASGISFWDRLNVFKTTPAEAQHKALKLEIAALTGVARDDVEAIDQLFSRALVDYPPAALACDVADVVYVVERITAVCRSRTVTTGTGSNKKTETRYYCALEGHGAAMKAMRRWSAAFAAVFGALPSYLEALELWQLRGWHPHAAALAGRELGPDDDEPDDPHGPRDSTVRRELVRRRAASDRP